MFFVLFILKKNYAKLVYFKVLSHSQPYWDELWADVEMVEGEMSSLLLTGRHLHAPGRAGFSQSPHGCNPLVYISHHLHAARKAQAIKAVELDITIARKIILLKRMFQRLTAAQNCVRPRATFSQPACEHFFPPPCLTQNFVDDCADLSQPSTEHRRPPP